MKKIIILFLLLSFSVLQADIIHNISLLDKKNKCIYNDYYEKGGRFYYHYVSNDRNYSTTSKSYTLSIIHGYMYDTDTNICSPEAWTVLGMTSEDFNFLNALFGLFFGLFLLVSVSYLFMTVGGKK